MGVFQKNDPKIVAVSDDSSDRVPDYPRESESIQEGVVHGNVDHLQRRLGNRQIQLIASETSCPSGDTALCTPY